MPEDQLYAGITETLKKHGIGLPEAPTARPASEIVAPPPKDELLSGIQGTLQKHGMAMPGAPAPGPAATAEVKSREDFTDKYNTPLPPDKETKFQAWAKDRKNAAGGLVLNDLPDYDVRGRWQQLEQMTPEERAKAEAPGAHGPDTWKKPSHITFSKESKYHGVEGHEGGTWDKDAEGKDTFTPGATNLKFHGSENLQKYFAEQEPGIKLNTPGPRAVPFAPQKPTVPALYEEPVIGAKEALGDMVSRWASLIDPGSFISGAGAEITPETRELLKGAPETRQERLEVGRKATTAGLFPEGAPKPAEGVLRGVLRGAGAAPVALTELAMLAPLAGEAPAIAKGAITFALQGLTGEEPIKGAAHGAALGAILGINHQLAGKIADPVVQWLAKIAGGMTIGGGATALTGGGTQEIAKDALLFGLFEVLGLPGKKAEGAKPGEALTIDWDWMEQQKVPKRAIDALKYEDVESPDFVQAVDDVSRGLFRKTPEAAAPTAEAQKQAIFGGPLGQIVESAGTQAEAVQQMMAKHGLDGKQAERFYDLYKKGDAKTATKEFPEFSTWATESQRRASAVSPEGPPEEVAGPMATAGSMGVKVEPAAAGPAIAPETEEYIRLRKIINKVDLTGDMEAATRLYELAKDNPGIADLLRPEDKTDWSRRGPVLDKMTDLMKKVEETGDPNAARELTEYVKANPDALRNFPRWPVESSAAAPDMVSRGQAPFSPAGRSNEIAKSLPEEAPPAGPRFAEPAPSEPRSGALAQAGGTGFVGISATPAEAKPKRGALPAPKPGLPDQPMGVAGSSRPKTIAQQATEEFEAAKAGAKPVTAEAATVETAPIERWKGNVLEWSAPKVDSLIEQYKATGRTATRYPRRKEISVDGRTMSEKDAISKMQGVLKQTPDAAFRQKFGTARGTKPEGLLTGKPEKEPKVWMPPSARSRTYNMDRAVEHGDIDTMILASGGWNSKSKIFENFEPEERRRLLRYMRSKDKFPTVKGPDDMFKEFKESYPHLMPWESEADWIAGILSGEHKKILNAEKVDESLEEYNVWIEEEARRQGVSPEELNALEADADREVKTAEVAGRGDVSPGDIDLGDDWWTGGPAAPEEAPALRPGTKKASKLDTRLDELTAEYPDIDRERAATVLRAMPEAENHQVAAMSADPEMFSQVARGNLKASEKAQLLKKASDAGAQGDLFGGGGSGKLFSVHETPEYTPTEDEIAASTRTGMAGGALRDRTSKVSKWVIENVSPETTILDFGAGREAIQTAKLKEAGFNPVAYDQGRNVIDGVHDPDALNRQYSVVMGSNVLNTQGSREMLESTVSKMAKAVAPDGKLIANFPKDPRYPKGNPITLEEIKSVLERNFRSVKRIGGTESEPIWQASDPIKTLFLTREESSRREELTQRDRSQGLTDEEGRELFGLDAKLGDERRFAKSLTTEQIQNRLGKFGTASELAPDTFKETSPYQRGWVIHLKNGQLATIVEGKDYSLKLGPRDILGKDYEAMGITSLEGRIVAGSFKPLSIGSVIELARGQGLRVFDHESWHMIEHWLLNDKERAALVKEFGDNEELRAEAYASWKPKEAPNTIFQKILDFFQRITKAITGKISGEDVFAAARSGELFGRGPMERAAEGAKARLTDEGGEWAMEGGLSGRIVGDARAAREEGKAAKNWLMSLFASNRTSREALETHQIIAGSQAQSATEKMRMQNVFMKYVDAMGPIKDTPTQEFLKMYESGQHDQITHPIFKAFADEFKAEERRHMEIMTLLGDAPKEIPNYIDHLWKENEAREQIKAQLASQISGGRSMRGPDYFKMLRTVVDIPSGIAAGLEPRFDTLPEMVLAGRSARENRIAATKRLNFIKDKGYEKVVRDLDGGTYYLTDTQGAEQKFKSINEARRFATDNPGSTDPRFEPDVPQGWKAYPGGYGEVWAKVKRRGGLMIPERADEETLPLGGGPERAGYEEVPKVDAWSRVGYRVGPADVVRQFEDFLGRGLSGNTAFELYQSGLHAVRHSQMAISFFHAFFESINSVATHAGGGIFDTIGGLFTGDWRRAGAGLKTWATSPLAPFQDIKQGVNINKTLMENGIGIPGEATDNRLLQDARTLVGGGMRPEAESKLATILSRHFKEAFKLKGGLSLGKRGNELLQGMSSPTMEVIVPFSKQGSTMFNYLNEVKRWERANPGVAPTEEVLRDIAYQCRETADHIYGRMAKDNVAMNDMVKSLLTGVLQFPTWQFGTVSAGARTILGAKDVVGKVFDMMQGKEIRQLSMKDRQALQYVTGLLFTVGMTGALMTYAMTGKKPETMADYFFPKTGETTPNGSEERLQLPSYFKDAMGFTHHPFKTVGAKLASPIHIVTDLINNQDYWGAQIYDPHDWIGQRGIDIIKYMAKSTAPFALQSYEQGAKGGPARFAMSLFGVRPVPREIANTPAQNVIDEYNQMMRASTTTKESAEKKRLKSDLMKLARDEDEAGFKTASDKAVSEGQFTRQQIKQIVEESQAPPQLGRFVRLPLEWATRAWNEASGYEKEQWQPYFLKKIMGEKPENLIKLREPVVAVLEEMGLTEAANKVTNLTMPEESGVDLTGLGMVKPAPEMSEMANVDRAIADALQAKLEPKERKTTTRLPGLFAREKKKPFGVLGL